MILRKVMIQTWVPLCKIVGAEWQGLKMTMGPASLRLGGLLVILSLNRDSTSLL